MVSHIYTSPHPSVDLPEGSVWDLVWSNPNQISDEKVAVIDGATRRTWTRAGLKKAAEEAAFGYRHELGMSPGDVLCIFSPNSFYYHLMVLATQCAGLVVSGANASYTAQELQHQLENSGTKVLLVHPAVLEVALSAVTAMGWSKQQQQASIVLAVPKQEAGPAGDVYRSLSNLMNGQRLSPHRFTEPKTTVAYLGYSSGTSGKAKGVRTSAYNMTSVLSMSAPIEFGHNDVHLGLLPLNHIYGLTSLIHLPVLHGSTVVLLNKFELEPYCQMVERYKVTVSMLVPPIALLLARSPVVDRFDMSTIRLMVCAAAPLGHELQQELANRLETSVTQAFGLTETSPSTHYCPISPPTPGSVGCLLPHMRARICDPVTGEDAEVGKHGEILLQGPNVMLGYLNNPRANAEALHEDADGVWFKTGDIGYVDSRGYFYITDRIKELIKYKGFQIAPAELEATLLECPFVADTAVIGIWMEDQATELPRAYVVLSAEGKKQADPSKAVGDWVAGKVSNQKKLRGGVRIVESVPKSPAGKILRRLLRDEAKAEATKAQAAEQKSKL